MDLLKLDDSRELLLRSFAPACYEELLSIFKEVHLHPYDVWAGVIPDEGGCTLVLRYGEGLREQMDLYVPAHSVEPPGPEVTAFFREAAKACKQTMIADYYKMMKP